MMIESRFGRIVPIIIKSMKMNEIHPESHTLMFLNVK